MLIPVEVIVDEVNRFLRGWATYFRFGNSTVRFEKIMHHAWTRIAGYREAPQTFRALGGPSGLPVPDHPG